MGEGERAEGEPPTSGEGTKAGKVSQAAGFLLLLGILAGVFFFFRYIEPDHVTQKQNPNFIDNIFADPVVIAAARIVLLSVAIVLLFGSIYVAASSVVRIKRGQWLRRAGPFEANLAEAEEAEEELESVEDMLLDLYSDAIEENEELSERLQERDEQMEQLYAAYLAALGDEGAQEGGA
jgi:exonuclease VII small subunit